MTICKNCKNKIYYDSDLDRYVHEDTGHYACSIAEPSEPEDK